MLLLEAKTRRKNFVLSKDISANMTVVSTYQVKSIYIDNFKAFNEFSMDFSPMTILVGNNSSGRVPFCKHLFFSSIAVNGQQENIYGSEAVRQRISPREDFQRLRKS